MSVQSQSYCENFQGKKSSLDVLRFYRGFFLDFINWNTKENTRYFTEAISGNEISHAGDPYNRWHESQC